LRNVDLHSRTTRDDEGAKLRFTVGSAANNGKAGSCEYYQLGEHKLEDTTASLVRNIHCALGIQKQR